MSDFSHLDRIDFEILRLLQNDGRLSNKELAGRVGLAPSSCLARVRNLRTWKVLLGTAARVEPRALGIGLRATVAVSLARSSRSDVEAMVAHLEGRPEVVSIQHVAGRHDLLVQVAVRDSDHLRDFTLDALSSRREVASVETWVIFDERRATNLPCLMDPDR